ncbi:MAG: VCBS repeat-containing protein [Planctomycetota bacterium]|nr:VCBS repeat-containing protein [Planctomycetota bacterium]
MRLFALTAIVVLTVGSFAEAQLSDLQPGRNFPTAATQFGNNRSENIDVGDVDNDGDLDVIVGNGGDFGPEPNRIYINRGGLQGGTVGTFSQETNTRLAGAPNDTSRDIEFADIDNDGDLDIYVPNRGTASTGEPSRFFINQGGLQNGTIGFFQEDTIARWRTLASVPNGQQMQGGNTGAWRDWSCDCDFADLDDDGDLDLFHSSYGPNIDGSEISRVFLNDGNGFFDELYPWINAAADARNHTMDMDLVDLDGDLDIDVVNSSRDSQARIFINQTYNPLQGSTMFRDTTQQSLLDMGATYSGGSNYEGEFGDLDDDVDFDIWMKNYNSFNDRILVNQGVNAQGIPEFVRSEVGGGPDMIKGDPNVDENEIDLLDFDGDGDLDAFSANFSGTNYIYAGGNAQGLTGQYHRTGTTSGGSQYNWNEVPSSSNSGTTLDGECADMDNDGDEDIMLSNDSNQANRLWINTRGIPDTHAPTFYILQDDFAGGSGDVVVHAQIRDNSNFYIINYYNVDLVYSVNGGPTQTQKMFAQGSQQFRGVLPSFSSVNYHVEATDMAGNVGISPTVNHGGGGPWSDLGNALAGVNGDPVLSGTGAASPGSSNTLALTNAAPASATMLFVGLGPAGAGVPFKGGTLIAFPFFMNMPLFTNGAGSIPIPFVMPGGTSGLKLVFQYGISDGAAVSNVALSNGLQVDIP